MRLPSIAASSFALAIGLVAATPAAAQEGYRLPPPDVVDIVTRAPSPRVSVSPDNDQLLLLEREALPPVAELAKPMEKLAGMRLDAAINDRYGTRATIGLSLQDIASGDLRPVAMPADADISDVSWAPDGSSVVFTNTRSDAMDLYVLDTQTAAARKVMTGGVNPIFQTPRFLPDGSLLVLTIPEARGPRPVASLTPVGPAIQDASGGQEAQTRTYQDLLENPHDEAMFEWLTTSQPVVMDADGSNKRKLGEPRIYTSVAFSPDGKYMLMEWIEKPFSYQVPYYRFPTTTAVYTRDGKLVKTIVRQPLADALPVQGVVKGPRNVQWHPTEDALLVWAEAQDGGDPRVETDNRDNLMALAAPFDSEARVLVRLEDRASGAFGIEKSDDLVAYEYDRDTRELRQTLVDVTGNNAPRQINIRNIQDAYADPGEPVTTYTDRGFSVARSDDGALLLTGAGASPEGLRPFLRRFDLDTLETTELWRSSGEQLESVIDVLDDDGDSFITYFENPIDPGNVRLHRKGEVRALTDFRDPHPELTGIKRELVTYKRADGVDLTATLYLPPEYKEGDKLPVVVWAYPREYNDAATAGQNRDSPYRFTQIGGYSQLFFLTQGYAVLDRAAMPVIGDDPETVNDTFIEQIVASAQAAVDFTVERGFGDGVRVGVGGHSYGAFMTAHLLAQSDIFRAGIARSGAYNRTLTPFGFQSERRIFWDTPATYYELSPFMAADKINEPILFTHGMNDSNSGTFPQQSERMFAAVKGTGGTARLVMLPHEDHGYRGRESVLHVLAEMFDWFDTHVKNAPVERDTDDASAE
ncbi:S9 family peptidase [Pseudoblastomonas halimionae]|uniref:Prolyl oligopeptidase family serine peptidase n=1 Tax=Alteriqipengyuania halimionae TaxID=1926630 RepID=A0A6I4U0F6_9SPHN|nr:prolyl oligopeptidase family serine peptidase [Alteriqipengyuania halimionae]MXP09358.1 prolyl oligopeptidase family serine peptidase [Alteriqipengyuania halimionae]